MSRKKDEKNFEAVRSRPGLTVRLDSQTREALEGLAKQEDRSAANMVERILKEYLRSKGLLNGNGNSNPTEISPAWSKAKRPRADATHTD